MRARLHVKGSELGFYREGTHELCDPRCSRQLLPETLDVLAAVSAALKEAGVIDGRALELSENRAATERALYLEVSSMGRGEIGLEALLDLPGATGVGIARAGVPIAASGSPIVADELVLSERNRADRVRAAAAARHGILPGQPIPAASTCRACAGAGARRADDRPVCRRRPVRPCACRSRARRRHRGGGRPQTASRTCRPTRRRIRAAFASKRGRSRRRSGIAAPWMVGPLSWIPPDRVVARGRRGSGYRQAAPHRVRVVRRGDPGPGRRRPCRGGLRPARAPRCSICFRAPRTSRPWCP